MKRYETVFILTPVLSEDQAAETVEKFKNFLKEKKSCNQARRELGLEKISLSYSEEIYRVLYSCGV